MRWYVSIGIVLVAGVLAGDVAGVAAPNPANRPGQASGAAGPQLSAKDGDPTVDVELVLAVDVSGSVSQDPAPRALSRNPSSRSRS